MRTIVPGVRTLVVIACGALLSLSAKAQSITTGNGKLELGLGIGPMFFLGDLGGHQGTGKTFVKDVNMPLTKLSKGLYVNYYPAEWLGLRVAANFSRIEGSDSIIKNGTGDEQARKLRNLQFQSKVMEAYVAAELYPTIFFEKYDGLQGKLRPYGVIGFGMFKFNPQGLYYDQNGGARWVDLQPLRLEGQGMRETGRTEYSLTQYHVPMGFGAKYYLKENFYLGLEVLHRKTFTDYIDDVSTTYIDPSLFQNYLTPEQASMANQLHFRENFVPNQPMLTRPDRNEQRGDPTENDAFFSTMLRFGWRLNDNNSPMGRAARQMRCPSFY